MFKLIVVVFIFFSAMYYIDIIVKIRRDERDKKVRYKGMKLFVPFAYWIFPYKVKKPKRKSKVETQKTEKDERPD